MIPAATAIVTAMGNFEHGNNKGLNVVAVHMYVLFSHSHDMEVQLNLGRV